MTRLLVAAVAVAVLPTAAPAEFLVTVTNAAAAPGGTGRVEVLVRSIDGTDRSLSGFNLDVRVVGGGGAAGFAAAQPDAALYADPRYVFFNNSFNAGGPLGTVGTVTDPNDRFFGADDADDPLFPAVVGGTDRLLALLDVTLSGSAVPGASYVVAVSPGLTVLRDEDGNPATGVQFEGGSVAAVPEPSSLALAGLAAVAGGLRRWAGRR